MLHCDIFINKHEAEVNTELIKSTVDAHLEGTASQGEARMSHSLTLSLWVREMRTGKWVLMIEKENEGENILDANYPKDTKKKGIPIIIIIVHQEPWVSMALPINWISRENWKISWKISFQGQERGSQVVWDKVYRMGVVEV